MPEIESSEYELADRLIYDNETISINEILKIFFDRSLEELKEAERYTPESRAKEQRIVEKAKKAMGIVLSSDQYDSRPPVIPQTKPKHTTLTKKEFEEREGLGVAFAHFRNWVGIAFGGDTHAGVLDNAYSPREFFGWVVDYEIVKQLKNLSVPTTPRAHRFIGFAEAERTDVSPATQEEIKPLSGKSSKLKKPKQKGLGGKPSKSKKNGIRQLRALFKNKIFKKTIKSTPNKELPFTRQVLTGFIDDPAIAITPKLIEKIKDSDSYFKEIFGTSRRNFIDRWIREVRGRHKAV